MVPIEHFQFEGLALVQDRGFFTQVDVQAVVEKKLDWIPKEAAEFVEIDRLPLFSGFMKS
jgi:transposase